METLTVSGLELGFIQKIELQGGYELHRGGFGLPTDRESSDGNSSGAIQQSVLPIFSQEHALHSSDENFGCRPALAQPTQVFFLRMMLARIPSRRG
jgi:hypothetical protein